MNEEKILATRSRLAELAAKFLDRTDVDISAMRTGLARIESGDAASLADIRHLAHRMVGTGATLGFESLSGSAHRIEQLTESCAPGALPDEQFRARLAGALDSLASELRKLRDA